MGIKSRDVHQSCFNDPYVNFIVFFQRTDTLLFLYFGKRKRKKQLVFAMFSFFRRSKKDSESHGSKENKDKKNKDGCKENSASPSRKHKEMCKNNITMQNFESAPHSASVTSVLADATEVSCPNFPETASVSVSGGEPEKIDSNTTNETPIDKMMEWNNRKEVSSRANTYANMLRALESQKEPRENRGSGVKPCGHGTVAVLPKIPVLQANKRDDSNNTPPESPKPEVIRKLSDTAQSISAKEDKLRNAGQENGPVKNIFKRQTNNDTVTGIMKLRIDIPQTPPPADDVEKVTPPLEKLNITDAEKYVELFEKHGLISHFVAILLPDYEEFRGYFRTTLTLSLIHIVRPQYLILVYFQPIIATFYEGD